MTEEGQPGKAAKELVVIMPSEKLARLVMMDARREDQCRTSQPGPGGTS